MATVEKLEGNQAKLTVTVDQETFAAAMQKAYIKTVKHYNVPGFRKGHAPRKVIENMYGEGAFYEDAFEEVYPDAYDAAIREHGLEPVDKPDVTIETISTEEGVVFTAKVTLMPEVTLGAYKGIEVEKKAYTVEDAQVDSAIEQEREKAARFIEAERPIENGDQIILDYSGSVDGVKFDGGTAEGQTLVIGSGTFIPGFEEQLIGVAPGEEKEITVTFPEDYHAENLKGKDAVFAVKVKTVQVKELPALDDEFAKDISEFDTLDALKASKRESLEKQAKERAEAEQENEAIEKVVENATVDIPHVMIHRQMDYMLQDMAYRLSMSGISMEDYCKYLGTDMETIRAGYHKEAEARVKMQLVIGAVSKAENVEATQEDIDRELEQYAPQTGKSAEEFKKTLSPDDIQYFEDRIVAQKTVKLIMDNAKLVAAKKPAAKKAAPKKKAEDAETGEKPAPKKKAASKEAAAKDAE